MTPTELQALQCGDRVRVGAVEVDFLELTADGQAWVVFPDGAEAAVAAADLQPLAGPTAVHAPPKARRRGRR
jgi:hypothetical protein